MSLSDELMAALGNAPIKFWACPVEGHSFPTDRDGRPVPTVEWDGDVAGCLAYACGRLSTDPVPRGECICEGDTRDGEDCTGQCCGPGQCSCSPDACPHCGRSGVHTCKGPRTTGSQLPAGPA